VELCSSWCAENALKDTSDDAISKMIRLEFFIILPFVKLKIQVSKQNAHG
jgi:hypothetical protein